MGNHQAGRAMGIAASVALSQSKKLTPKKALQLLDQICEPWRGCDAEFEAEDPKRPGHIHPEYTFYTDPDGPIGRLINAAFGHSKGVPYETENEQEAWYNGPYHKFHERYEFC